MFYYLKLKHHQKKCPKWFRSMLFVLLLVKLIIPVYRAYTSFNDMEKCSVFKGQTGAYTDTKNVDFSQDMKGIQNPLEKQLTFWPVSVISENFSFFLYQFSPCYVNITILCKTV